MGRAQFPLHALSLHPREKHGYTVPVRVERWSFREDPAEILERLAESACRPGVFVVRFEESRSAGVAIGPRELEAWTASRAVTVADIATPLAGPALGFALCADLVYLRAGAHLELPPPRELPSPALIFAAGRAGPRAPRRVLLGGGEIPPEEAMALGLVHGVSDPGDPLPLPLGASLAALTAARDLLRSKAAGGGALALESAVFRLLFAVGDPEEGATAFLERRKPDFGGDSG